MRFFQHIQNWIFSFLQIFGDKNLLAENVLIENCRFAIPTFQFPDGNAGVNAALMMQLEYGNADGITFKDIMIDCGGPWSPCRSSMPREVPRGEEEGAPSLWQKNVVFENIYYIVIQTFFLFTTNKSCYKTITLFLYQSFLFFYYILCPERS